MSNEKGPPLTCIQGIIPSSVRIIISHSKDPYETTSISWTVKGFFSLNSLVLL